MKQAKLDKEALRRCARRVKILEAGIIRLLQAEKAGEMGNRDKALEHLERLMEQI